MTTAGGAAGSKPRQTAKKASGGGGCQFYKGKRKGVLQLKEVILDEPLEVRKTFSTVSLLLVLISPPTGDLTLR